MRLEGRRALITGGGSGIGRATCELFAREGATVAVVDLREERARETAAAVARAGGTAVALVADVADGDAVSAMAAGAVGALGGVDILVNNAAFAEGDDILAIDEVTWDLNLAVVLKSVYLVSRSLLPQMLARGDGAIVNISSVNGITGVGQEAYSAGKAGVLSLTQNMALRYGRRGVRVNAVCPGTIRTPIWDPIVAHNPRIFEQLAQHYPLGRVGEPEDVARAILFLASADAAWITGQTLVVDGGITAGCYGVFDEIDLGQSFGGKGEA